MRKLLSLLLALISLTARGQDSASVKKDSVQATPWALYHAIEARLDTVYKDDQSDRNLLDDYNKKGRTRQVDSLWKVIAKKDSANLIKVKDILDHHGWLGIDAIGEKANLAFFLVIQHAYLPTQIKYLPMMREAVQHGDAKGEDLALLEDRVLSRQGKLQIYGSQVRTGKTGKYEFYPIEDERNVNKRRAAIGLEPLEQYARNFGIDYHLPK